MLLLGEKRRTVAQSPVGVEKLFPAKFAKIKSCQDAPQTTFSVFLDIFYPPNSCCFEENGVFQQPQAFTIRTPVNSAIAVSANHCGGISVPLDLWETIS